MRLNKSIHDFGHKIYRFLTNLKVVKYATFMGLGVFICAIIIGVCVAQFDPDGYNMLKNYISDMGSFNHTPLPYFLDYGNMISSILFIPCAFYLEKKLAPLPQSNEDLVGYSRMRVRLGSYGLIWMLIGLVGMFGTGFFSEDRTHFLYSIGLYGLHWIFTIVVFVGFAMTGFFYGLLITFYDTYVPKALGIYMICGPSIIAIILFSFGFQPIHEWIMLFSLFGWIIPISLLSIKQIKQVLTIK